VDGGEGVVEVEARAGEVKFDLGGTALALTNSPK
jgi:hypothetical protein